MERKIQVDMNATENNETKCVDWQQSHYEFVGIAVSEPFKGFNIYTTNGIHCKAYISIFGRMSYVGTFENCL